MEESHRKRRVKECKKINPADLTGYRCCRGSFGDQNRPKFKENLGNSTSSRILNAKMNKSGTKKGNDSNAERSSKPCGKCGRMHSGECFEGTNSCYKCDKSGHMVRDF